MKNFLKTWGVLVLLCMAMFIIVVDTTMVNVSISAIVADLDTDVSTMQMAIALYSLVMASFMITSSKFAEIHGIKKVFLVGLVVYGIGTLIAATAGGIGQLIFGWSIVEGLAAAVMLPITMTLLIANYSGTQRAIGFGVLGGVQAAAAAVGPIFGGFLTTYASWRWAFGLELVFVVIILLFSKLLKDSAVRNKKASVDYFGSLLSIVGLASIVFAVIRASKYGWWQIHEPLILGGQQIAPFGLSPVPFLILFGILVLAAFVCWQYHREKAKQTPLVHLSLFKLRQFVNGFLTDANESLVLAGVMFVFPVYLQQVMNFNALQTGLTLLPMSIVVLILSLTTSGLGKKFAPKRVVQFGVLLMMLGAFILSQSISIQLTWLDLAPGLVIFGAGVGLMIGQLTNITLSGAPAELQSEASGVNNTIKEFGTSLGTALIGAIFLTSVFSGISANVEANSDLPQPVKTRVVELLQHDVEKMSDSEIAQKIGDIAPATATRLEKIVDESIVESMQNSVLVILFFCGLCFLSATFIPNKKESVVK